MKNNKEELFNAYSKATEQLEQMSDITGLIAYVLSQAATVVVAFLKACLDEQRLTDVIKQTTYSVVKAGVLAYVAGLTIRDKFNAVSIPAVTIPNFEI